MNIGIDWDGTADRYGKAIGKLALLAEKNVIITLNKSIDVFKAAQGLNPAISDYIVEVMPDEAFTGSGHEVFECVAEWKYQMCIKHGIDVMFDDEPYNIWYLSERGITCIKCDGDFTYTKPQLD